MMMWIRGNNLKGSTMKIYKILFAAAVALSIVSCSKESVQGLKEEPFVSIAP